MISQGDGATVQRILGHLKQLLIVDESAQHVVLLSEDDVSIIN